LSDAWLAGLLGAVIAVGIYGVMLVIVEIWIRRSRR
jgi:predicted PurR-regulated permease PerM